MSKPKISIVVPIFKSENTIRRLLDSFECQPYKDIEFFLIDNASPDKCGEICQEYVDRDSRFVLHILNENVGYIRARMYGINNCNGEFVGFSDSDDYIPENCYEEILECICKDNPDFITCSFCGVFGDELRHHNTAVPNGIYTDEKLKNEFFPVLFGNDNISSFLEGFMWKNFYKRDIIIKNSIDFEYELVPYEDQIFNIDFVKFCKKIVVIDKEIYYYVSNENSITGTNSKNLKLLDEYSRILKLYYAKLDRSNGLYKKFIANDLIANLYSMFLSAAKLSTDEEINKLIEIIDENIRVFVKENSDINSLFYKITRHFVSNGQYKLLIKIIKLVLKVRG